jgi:predicted MFS family arabinose efflux permease
MSHRQGSLLSKVATESGFTTLYTSSRDAKLMCISRFVRLFGYGTTFLILVHFLTSVGNISDAQVGLFMTLTLLGDAMISFCLTIVTDKLGRRRVLAVGAISMMFSGLIFAVSSNYYILVLASIFGVISPR